MRAPTERDPCQAKLDILIEGFMRADWTAYRDAAAWLRDFGIERGRVLCGGYWFMPQQIEAVRKRARERATRAGRSPPRLILEINIGELLAVVVAHDKAGGLFLDRPRGREAAAIRHLGCVHLAKSQSSHKGNYSRVATAKATTVTAPFRLVLELDIGERLSAV